MKSSAVEERKVLKEYVVGVRIGSTFNILLRKSGVEEERSVGMQACMIVAGSKLGEMVKEGKRERHGYILRGEALIGEMIRRVRTISRGARSMAAMAVAATATPKLVNGLGLSNISSPPIPLPAAPTRPGSGILSKAQIALRNQPSVVLSRKL
jgi:hypothetical protein